MEEGEGVPNSLADNLGKLQRTFEDKGLEFIPENGGGAGIRFRERRSAKADEGLQPDQLTSENDGGAQG